MKVRRSFQVPRREMYLMPLSIVASCLSRHKAGAHDICGIVRDYEPGRPTCIGVVAQCSSVLSSATCKHHGTNPRGDAYLPSPRAAPSAVPLCLPLPRYSPGIPVRSTATLDASRSFTISPHSRDHSPRVSHRAHVALPDHPRHHLKGLCPAFVR